MNDTKHTPGPWRRVAPRNQARESWGEVRSSTGGEDIAHVWMTPREGAANANLIAAAPELLEALTGILALADLGTDEPECWACMELEHAADCAVGNAEALLKRLDP